MARVAPRRMDTQPAWVRLRLLDAEDAGALKRSHTVATTRRAPTVAIRPAARGRWYLHRLVDAPVRGMSAVGRNARRAMPQFFILGWFSKR